MTQPPNANGTVDAVGFEVTWPSNQPRYELPPTWPPVTSELVIHGYYAENGLQKLTSVERRGPGPYYLFSLDILRRLVKLIVPTHEPEVGEIIQIDELSLRIENIFWPGEVALLKEVSS